MASLKFDGCSNFRQRLVYATLSSRRIRIDNIRADSEEPGLKDFEANFLRLLDTITNGTTIEVNETGTKLRYKPGVIVNGSRISHDCGTSRAIGWFLEPLLALAPFGKAPLSITLYGITNDDTDLSIDYIRTTLLPTLKHFGVEEGVEIKIKKRGAPPAGGGEVHLRISHVKELRPIQILEEGFVKRIRGVAYATRVSPQFPNRMIKSSRALLNHFIPDVYIFSDHYRGAESGSSPGFAICLQAETTEGRLLAAETAARPGELPEDVGDRCSRMLCSMIRQGGCIDLCCQPIVFLFMALCPEDVSKIRIGQLSEHSIECLRLIRDFFGVSFKIRSDPSTNTILLSCMGIGFKNMARRVQ